MPDVQVVRRPQYQDNGDPAALGPEWQMISACADLNGDGDVADPGECGTCSAVIDPLGGSVALQKLAAFHRARGQYSRAEPLLRRALAIWESSLGDKHPDVALALGEVASIHQLQGAHARAEPLLRRALAIQEAALGATHPEVALTLGRLASVHQQQGAHDRAAPLLQRTLAIQEATLGRAHPDVAFTLNQLARLRLAQQRLDDALPLLERAFDISEGNLRQEALGLSEVNLAGFLQLVRVEEERLHALLRAYPEDARVRRLALSAMLLRKGRSVEEVTSTSEAIYRSLGEEDRALFLKLRELRSQLAKLSFDGPGLLEPAEHQRHLLALGLEADALEARLSLRSAPLRMLRALPPPGTIVDQVAAALPRDGALVELIVTMDRALLPGPNAPEAKWSPERLRYLAVVLFPDGGSRAVDLGPAAPIDLAASRLIKALARRDASYLELSQALHARVVRPLLPLLGETRRLLVAPDGQLGLVPFAALHDGKRFLVDAFDLTYLTSGKDLLPRASRPATAGPVVVLADPDFGAPAASPATGTEGRSRRSTSLARPSTVLREELAGQPWPPLPGTRHEAEAVQRFFPQAQVFLGADASRERLFQLTAPRVLHIATHGFFVDDTGGAADTRAVGHFGGLGGSGTVRYPPDPLLRSGLVFAEAAGKEARPGGARPQSTTSLVTALELAGLDLWGTELVVLSACDTGRGAVRPGQGVYGLRRAFVIAGAQTVVMSLWKINDDTTRVLMGDYYRHLIAGRGRSAALRDAMLALRQSRPHPYYWAPFIVLGRDAPLGVADAGWP